MTKAINLLSLIQAQRALGQDAFGKYAACFGIEIRPHEIDDLYSLAEQLQTPELDGHLFDQYYVGYRIPQIGKEFDLLRFGDNYHVNIELKADCESEKMQRQLCRNRYYLSYLEKDLFCISYSSLTQQFFVLTTDETLEQVESGVVRNILASQAIEEATSIDHKFKPSAYLVSPFNSPAKFMLGQYFLTSQQEGVKRQIMALVESSASSAFVSLTGAAGTGKTLLAYDIVADLARSGRTPLIIHCGKLNEGHHTLVNAGWNIISIRDMWRHQLSSFGPILLDEAQRIRPAQFSSLVSQINSHKGQCIFSYDRSQTLDDHETRNDIGAQIAAIPGVSSFSLSEKIRTNKEIADFIKSFVNSHRGLKVKDTGNIEFLYFSNSGDANRHLASLDAAKWKVIKFTPSQYNSEHHETYSVGIQATSHDVIGQEYDGVAVMVDQYFSYNLQGNLIYTGRAYYQLAKMLFQNMTRARSRLRLIIINNLQMLDACMRILE
ncbi:hypothetical protein ACFWZ4_09245 [Frateuria sp. GZRe12]|uniref:hypothetical protein n=1 Tax=Frateuria sp. GZRe12 TaxID=3351533 RepID=UPI003EDC8161